MADIFDIVADATRRDILRVLREASESPAASAREVSVSEIVAKLELSQPTISKHLKVLREAGLVAVREEGQHRYYRLDAAPLEQIDDWLDPFLSGAIDASGVAQQAELSEEVREFAQSVGKAIADTSHRVTGVVGRVVPPTWRRD